MVWLCIGMVLLLLLSACTTGVKKEEVQKGAERAEAAEEEETVALQPSPEVKQSTAPVQPPASAEKIKKSLSLILRVGEEKEFGGYTMQLVQIQGNEIRIMINNRSLTVTEGVPGSVDEKTVITVEKIYDPERAKVYLLVVS